MESEIVLSQLDPRDRFRCRRLVGPMRWVGYGNLAFLAFMAVEAIGATPAQRTPTLLMVAIYLLIVAPFSVSLLASARAFQRVAASDLHSLGPALESLRKAYAWLRGFFILGGSMMLLSGLLRIVAMALHH
jgi:hypothetical protein